MRLAIVVGHSQSAQGAVAVDGVQEWAWQRVLAHQVEAAATEAGHEVQVFYRPCGGYTRSMRALTAQVNRWAPDLVVSLHFNAFPEAPGQREVTGTMALHWPGSVAGRTWAVQLSAAVARAQGTRDRGARAQARSWSGASLWLLRSTRAPAVILETHYGDAASDHAQATAARDSWATARAIVAALPAAS
jgi:N-acetylmuramoyl-L-alanine amidase